MTIKKKIDLLKTKNILEKYSIILFFQHNNCTVADWSKLKSNVTQFDNTKIYIIKNSIVQKILLNDNVYSEKEIKNLFQGPNFLIGCNNLDQVDYVFKLIQSNSNIIFLGGFYENQIINHLDLEKLLQLKNQGISVNGFLEQIFSTNYSIYLNLLRCVNSNLDLNCLTIPKYQLIYCLDQLKNKKKNL